MLRTPAVRTSGALRRPLRANAAQAPTARAMPIPAPTGGWDAVSALENMPKDRAIVLDNWFPTARDVRVRAGRRTHADEMGSSAVESLLVYNGFTSAASKMFAATDGKIFDVTANAAGVEDVNALSNDRWQGVNFTTAGGKFLWICNGADSPMHFDGSSWASPVITGVTASDIIHVNAHKRRLWFVMRDSTKAAYLATNSIAGAATEFELGSYFRKGGRLVAMATWTQDGGDGGDDYACFISSLGEVAVYRGDDPSDANLWHQVGIFSIGRPLGARCFANVGGDLALINIDGVLPLSRALQTDRSAVAQIAVTANINDAMNEAARNYADNFGWEICVYPKGPYVLVNVPVQEGQTQHQYVMNTLTGAWCRFRNQNANCWAVFRDNIYFGTNDGLVKQADTGASDDGVAIEAIGQGAYNYYRSPGLQKQFAMLQAMLTTDSNARPALGMSTDFKDNAALGVPTAAAVTGALYDEAVYDVDVYAAESQASTDWSGVSGVGMCGSIHFRATTIADSAVLRLNSFNVLYQPGSFV